jgi:hypothetical protein
LPGRLNTSHALGGDVGEHGPENEPRHSPPKSPGSEKVAHKPPAGHVLGSHGACFLSRHPFAPDVGSGDKGLENNDSSPKERLTDGEVGIDRGIREGGRDVFGKFDVFGKLVVIWRPSICASSRIM